MKNSEGVSFPGVCEINAHPAQLAMYAASPPAPLVQCWTRFGPGAVTQGWAFFSQGVGLPFRHHANIELGGAGVDSLAWPTAAWAFISQTPVTKKGCSMVTLAAISLFPIMFLQSAMFSRNLGSPSHCVPLCRHFAPTSLPAPCRSMPRGESQFPTENRVSWPASIFLSGPQLGPN